MALLDRFKRSWSVFFGRDHPPVNEFHAGMSYGDRPDRHRFITGHDRTIINTIYNRIALDCADLNLRHVRLDENNRYIGNIDSKLNYCLSSEANKDQTSTSFIIDAVISLLDEGYIAIVPTHTSENIYTNNSFEVNAIRTAKILQWYPDHVKVRVWNDTTGLYEEIIVPKATTAIVENPFYYVMNEPNSTLRRLSHKLVLLDSVDESTASTKLNLLFQVPYTIKGVLRKQQAEERKADLEDQLTKSKYGIGYIDSTEKVIQLNRPLDNGLLEQIEYLTKLLMSQLGITEEILNGTANEEQMTNYYSRIIVPVMTAITEAMEYKFLTKTARSQKQAIKFYRDPFKLVPVTKLADIADKFTRNEILSSNEMRQVISMLPVDNPQADELRNKNINASPDQTFASTNDEMSLDENGNPVQNDVYSIVDRALLSLQGGTDNET